ncbi:MAG: glycoside hydrolase 100 family protein, partial [Thermobifida fusca]|nr:glycoside hydrolase 100 family protein [Thermobifida fusca]
THGWESGMDNSPRWDSPYAAVQPGDDLPPYVRQDLDKVCEADERPTDEEYDRYLWLIEEMRRVGYRADEVVRIGSFLVGDVFLTALFALSCDVLADLGEESGQDPEKIAQLRRWAARSRTAVLDTRDPETGLARDYDMRAHKWIAAPTIAGFAPLLSGGLAPQDQAALLATLEGPDWMGHPDLVAATPPTVSPSSPQFMPKQYWRGPQWPVISWLFSWAMRRNGLHDTAARIREETLRLVSDGTFAEYYHPLTGAPLGSRSQSWTAAVVLDWLYED